MTTLMLAVLLFTLSSTPANDAIGPVTGELPIKASSSGWTVWEPPGDISAGGPIQSKEPVVSEPPGEYEVIEGLAHWYGPYFTGRRMANGQPLDQGKLTIATWMLPLGTQVQIESACGSVNAEVTDKMPRPRGGVVVMDATDAVADALFCRGYGYSRRGVAYGTEVVTLTVQKNGGNHAH